MMRGFVILVGVFLLSDFAVAQDKALTVNLAQDSVDISTGFNGAKLSLFGVKEKRGHVAVVIKGPLKNVLVRQKNSVFGVWMNNVSIAFDDVPQFYDYALSDKEENILDEDALKSNGIGLSSLKFKAEENSLKPDEIDAFASALVRNKQVAGLFPMEARDIVFLSDTFFKAEFYVPPNVPTGDYVIETFLINDGDVLDKNETRVRVAQVGLSSSVYQFAHSYSLAYGLFIVFIAVIAGWLSNVVRQRTS
ncbi:MAG: transmembrane family protein [Alphaproteobacteria bacterium]|nr:transmembrane family protein [Alphaproteobacteria bacterium]